MSIIAELWEAYQKEIFGQLSDEASYFDDDDDNDDNDEDFE